MAELSHAAGQLIGVDNTHCSYDAAGQLLSRQAHVAGFQDQVSCRYDAARNLTACWGTGFTNSYAYDHARRLVREIRVISGQASSNASVYDGMDLIAKLDDCR